MFAGKTSAGRALRARPVEHATSAPVHQRHRRADVQKPSTIRDHVVGRVVDVLARGSGDPLIYFRGSFLS
jgi:hypothetical protein